MSFRAAIEELYDSRSRLAASSALHLLAWIGGGVGTFISFRLVGGHIALLNAVALEALLCTLRSIAAPVPAAIGVQEWGYAMLAPLFGLPAEMGVAVSLLKRAREIVLGVPALIYWQSVEGPHVPSAMSRRANALTSCWSRDASGFVGSAVARALVDAAFRSAC